MFLIELVFSGDMDENSSMSAVSLHRRLSVFVSFSLSLYLSVSLRISMYFCASLCISASLSLSDTVVIRRGRDVLIFKVAQHKFGISITNYNYNV